MLLHSLRLLEQSSTLAIYVRDELVIILEYSDVFEVMDLLEKCMCK